MLNVKNKLSMLRRKIAESFGISRYSRPSLFEIDRKLEHYLNYRNGFFIEVGANDGFSQSNTYYLERLKGWKGILVEGIPELYQQCLLERPKSKVFSCALVSSDFSESYVTMKYSNLMSLVEGALKSKQAEENHVREGSKIQKGVIPYQIKVPARTLTSILDECEVNEIDFFSLDVEGYELNVLKGLDFNKYRPKYMLIEARFKEEIDNYISDLYVEIDQLSYHDFLYKCKYI